MKENRSIHDVRKKFSRENRSKAALNIDSVGCNEALQDAAVEFCGQDEVNAASLQLNSGRPD
jgi:hypothetical protein